MAVALNPTKTLYSKKPENPENSTNITSYADSPSRQVRRSARVASLSPSSFTPLISEPLHSGTSSASSTNSYMPTSPSSKYSLMRGGYNGVSIDEIVINEIEPENRPKSKQLYPTLESFSNLRSNPDRKHPTLDFQPTNLSTPSTTLITGKSGITPAVKQINLQETPGQSQRVLEKLVSKVDMEEIAKATPLGNYYNRKATETTGAEKSKIQIIHSKTSGNNSVNNTANNNTINQQINPHTQPYNPLNMVNKRTPPKQTATADLTDNSDETVKVVRTLRNRSIVASPLPANSTLRRVSLAREEKPKVDVTVLFKKHQKNLLAYSLAGLFLIATLYHIYDGLRPVEPTSEPVSDRNFTAPVVPIAVPAVLPANSVDKDEILKLIDSKLTESKSDDDKKILNLFEQAQERLNQKLESITEKITVSNKKPDDFELQKKALDSVANTVKSLEKKFQTLEAKIEAVQKRSERNDSNDTGDRSEGQMPAQKQVQKSAQKQAQNSAQKQAQKSAQKQAHSTMLQLKVVRHLSTSPVQGGFFRSSEFPAENAVNPSTDQPFQFSGNRGKLAVALEPHQPLPAQLLINHPLLPDRSCAPRDIEIWALQNVLNERDNPVLIAKGNFDLSRVSQGFPLNQQKLAKLATTDKPIVLQLRIRNNHGNPRFTCLYKLAVTN